MGGLIGGGGGGKKAAKQAKQVAADQFKYNVDAANLSAGLNRYNETNPYGSVSWTKDPVTGQWSVNQQASPQLQGAIDSSLNMQTAGNNATTGAIGRVAGTIGTAFNPNLPAMGATPTADAAVRFTPNNTQAQTGLSGFGSAYDALFGAGGVPNPQNVQAGSYQSSLAPAGNIMSRVRDAGPINQSLGLQSSLGDAGQINSGVNLQTGLGNAGQIQRGVDLSGMSPELQAYQRSLDFSSAPALYGSGDYSADAENLRNTLNSRAEADIGRDYDLQRRRLEQQLSDQGIPLESEAARQRLDEINRGRDEALSNARAQNFSLAGQEQNRLSNLALTARQQAVGETSTAGQFGNDATSRAMGDVFNRAGMNSSNALAAGQFGNQAQAQQFEQMLRSGQFGNDAMMAAAQFGNQSQQQRFAQMLQSGQFGNDAMLAAANYNLGAQGQQYQQNANNMTQANAAQAQRFGQNLQSGQFANAAQQQLFADQLAASGQNYGQAANTQATRFGQGFDTQGRAFDQSLAGGQFYNQGQQQQFDQNMNRAGFYNQAAQQDFNNSMASAQQQNALRQQEFGIAADTRAIPINETLGFMKAVQPTPQLPSVQTPAINVAAPDYQGTYSNIMQANAQKNAGKMGALGTLGAAGITACWVAREVYGVDNLEWMRFRNAFFTKAPRWAQALYIRHGERLAGFIKGKPRLKAIFRFFMDKVR